MLVMFDLESSDADERSSTNCAREIMLFQQIDVEGSPAR